MRSLKYAAALLPLQFLHAFASVRPDADTTVVVTTTRTVTICPITDMFVCGTDVPDLPSTTSKKTEVTITTSGKGSSTITSSNGGSVTSTSSGYITSSGFGNGTTTTSFGGNGNGTTTSFTSSVTTTASGNGTTTTTTSACVNGTTTVNSIATPNCNSAGNRGNWCRKNIDSETHDVNFKTGDTKKFKLTITEATIDFDGTPRAAFAINGKTPGEAIVANWGDMVEVEVTNGLTSNATTIHWHGIAQYGTNDQDGVPGVTECGIAPGQSRTYKFLASTYGTGWYHSHALAQYGGGIRGPIIIHGPATDDYDLDMGTVMIDEIFTGTIFEMAYQIARIRGPLPASQNYLLNGKNRNAADTAGERTKWTVKEGKKHLFRIINSSAQSAYAVHFDNHKMKVIGADFTPIVPYTTDVLWIQSGQRYNVVVEMNQPKGAYYLRAVTQTGCGVQCANNGLGTSNGVFEYEGACGVTPTSSNFTITTAGDCKDEPLASLVPYHTKSAGDSGKFSSQVQLLPGGNAGGQNFQAAGGIITRWFLGAPQDLANNAATTVGNKVINVTYSQPTLKTLATVPDLALNSSIYSNSVILDGPANDWVYFVIQNNFQTSHPMHLHGHDFSVLGQGRGVFTSGMVGQLNFNNPIRRDTALLFGIGQPGAFTSGWTVIGFKTDNPGAWLMHCHIIWHADGGMGLQYLERPKEINAGKYYNDAFKNECKGLETYEANGGHLKDAWESGLKKRIDAHQYQGAGHHAHGVVRRNL